MSIEVREVIDRLAHCPPDEWPARLASAFPTDPALRKQALLWLHADRLQGREAEDGPDLGPSAERYELSLRIDAGATATVWQAYDRKLGRPVALKVFRDLEDSASVHRAIAEARAASDVISDHVVRVLDVNSDGEHPYIVMELVAEHDPDRDALALGASAASFAPRNIAEIARWLMQVARGVHDAHLRNVFHRDLKPQNVLVTPISRRARIADFGLAIRAAQRATNLTVRGTPEYMAPEQARGLPATLDPRTPEDRDVLVAIDVWGLGAIAFHLLYGRPPWRADNAGREAWEVAAADARPSLATHTSRDERIPPRLRAIVDKMLSPEPAQRYANAAVVAHELEAFLARRPTSFERKRNFRRLVLWCRRNPQLALTVLVSVGLASLTLVTHENVMRLRHERATLSHAVAEQQVEHARLDLTVEESRLALDRNRQRLAAERANLAALEAMLDEDRRAHEALLAAKDSALRKASSATRHVLEQLDASRAARASYEKLSAENKREADRLAKERDRARKDRDSARSERDALQRELEASETELANIRRERDLAREELARTQERVRSNAAREASRAGQKVRLRDRAPADAKERRADAAKESPSRGDTANESPSRGGSAKESPSRGDSAKESPSRGDSAKESPSRADAAKESPSRPDAAKIQTPQPATGG
ncbi:MAG: protein kinase [Kofleriaceae bacterium]